MTPIPSRVESWISYGPKRGTVQGRELALRDPVKGILDGRWTAWFKDLQVTSDGEETVISGPVADQAALHGLLTKVFDLGLFLISVRHLDTDDHRGSRPPSCQRRKHQEEIRPPVIMLPAPRSRPSGNTDQKHRSSTQGEREMTSNLTTARINAELEPFIPLFPAADLDNPVTARKKLAELAAAAAAPDTAGMEIEDRTVPADPDVPVRIYRPHRAQGAIVWLHGGGFVMGDLDTEHPWAARVADGSGAVVVSVGYRRAPEHRFPAALDDAYAALTWTAEHAAEIGIDPERIAVGGHAAGAGLAAAVALRARDQQGPPIRYQLLNQPELDDRQETWSARTFTETPFMTRDKVAASWRHYLGPAPASPYAAPARADDLSGLPPAYIASAEFDPNRDEAIGYAQRLLQAGVPVELHQWPGTFHGSQAVLSAQVSQRQTAELADALRRALAE